MSTPTPLQAAPAGSLAYAESLYSYAVHRLDAFSLRCWIIQRLMLDDGLDHASAERTLEAVLELARREQRARDVRGAERQRRRERTREIRRRAYGWARPGPIAVPRSSSN